MSSMAASTDSGLGLPSAQTATLPEVPAPGRIVTVRGSTWAVVEVRVQGLPRSPADEAAAGLQHVVDLQSLEDDRLGEELSVVWELELGHSVDPERGLSVDARWILVTSANFSWSAENRNLELGVLHDDPDLAQTVERQWRALEPAYFTRLTASGSSATRSP